MRDSRKALPILCQIVRLFLSVQLSRGLQPARSTGHRESPQGNTANASAPCKVVQTPQRLLMRLPGARRGQSSTTPAAISGPGRVTSAGPGTRRRDLEEVRVLVGTATVQPAATASACVAAPRPQPSALTWTACARTLLQARPLKDPSREPALPPDSAIPRSSERRATRDPLCTCAPGSAPPHPSLPPFLSPPCPLAGRSCSPLGQAVGPEFQETRTSTSAASATSTPSTKLPTLPIWFSHVQDDNDDQLPSRQSDEIDFE